MTPRLCDPAIGCRIYYVMRNQTHEMITIQSGLYKWFAYIPMAIMCLLGMSFLFVTLLQLVPFEESRGRDYALLFFFVWNAFVFYGTYQFLLKPTKIVIKPDSSFVLYSPLKSISLLPTDVHKIDRDSEGDWYIWCNNEKMDLRFFKQSQLAPFFQRLKAKNALIVWS